MSEWSAIYVNKGALEELISALHKLRGSKFRTSTGEIPDEYYDLVERNKKHPEIFLFGKKQNDWAIVLYSGLEKDSEIPLLFSDYLKCKVVVTLAESVSSYYYFCLYENGVKIREIETCYSTDNPLMINKGNPLPHEGPEPGLKEEYKGVVEYVFDFDAILEYCKKLGVEVTFSEGTIQWTICKGT